MGSNVLGVELMSPEGHSRFMHQHELKFQYRSCSIPAGWIILKGLLRVQKGDPEDISKKVSDYMEKRLKHQHLEYPSCGSVFKNPPGHYAAKLIEEAGLKGVRSGDALISTKHANFIVNTGRAKPSDIIYLIELAREKVKQRTGIELEPEIKILGD